MRIKAASAPFKPGSIDKLRHSNPFVLPCNEKSDCPNMAQIWGYSLREFRLFDLPDRATRRTPFTCSLYHRINLIAYCWECWKNSILEEGITDELGGWPVHILFELDYDI